MFGWEPPRSGLVLLEIIIPIPEMQEQTYYILKLNA